MKRLRNIGAIFAFSLLVLALPAVASAQWRDRDRDDDYYGNSRYNRNIRGTVQNLKNRARNFERQTNRIEDRDDDRDDRWRNRRGGGWNNNGDIDRIEDLADRFKKATDDLADEYGNGRNLNNSRDEAQRVLDIGSEIDQVLYSRRGNNNLQREWNQIRNDLRVLEDAYGYRNNNRGRNNRNGDWRNRMPFPLPF